jgi:small GTP-binding protein
MDEDIDLKLLVLGNAGVGKTNVLRMFTNGTSSTNYLATIGVDCLRRRLPIDKLVYRVTCWDTAGQERFQSITRAYYRGAHLIVFVYDVSNRESYQALERWMADVELDTPTCLLGNKTDLPSTVNEQEVQRDYAQLPHYRCSCRVPGTVTYALTCLLEEYVDQHGPPPPPPAPKGLKPNECCLLL